MTEFQNNDNQNDELQEKVEQKINEATDFWKKNQDKILTGAVIVLALKNRKLRRENVKLLARIANNKEQMVPISFFDQFFGPKS